MQIGDLVRHKRGEIKGIGLVIGRLSHDTWRVHWLWLDSVIAHREIFIEVIDESR